jgi:hypothetical protein
MASGAVWGRFAGLTTAEPQRLATIVTDHGDGTVTVTDPSGAQWRVSGTGTPGGLVWIEGGRIVGEGPTLTLVADQTV